MDASKQSASSAGLTAAAKDQKLWDEILNDSERNASDFSFDLGALVTGFVSDLNPLFDTRDDVLSRRKMVHQLGLVGRVTFESFGGDESSKHPHPFTGMFDCDDETNGLVRLSLGGSENGGPFIPAIALKLFRDDAPSADILAIHPFDGPKHFFAQDLVSFLFPSEPAVGQFVLSAKFKNVSLFNNYLGQHDTASVDKKGRVVPFPCVPFALRFEPADDLSARDVGMSSWSEQIHEVAPNTILYTIFGTDKPLEIGGTEYPIGRIRLTDGFKNSAWADHNLFFHHERPDTVLKLHPEWTPYVGEDFSTCPLQNPSGHKVLTFGGLYVFRMLNVVSRMVFSPSWLQSAYAIALPSFLSVVGSTMVPAYATFLHSYNVGVYADREQAPLSGVDRLTQWIMSRPKNLFADSTIYSGIRWFDLPGYILYTAGSYLTQTVLWGKKWPSETISSRRSHVEAWFPLSLEYQPLQCNILLLEFLANNVDLLDVLHPLSEQDDQFEIRTEFLDLYTQSSKHTVCLGATVRLMVIENALCIKHVCSDGVTFDRKEVPQLVANRIVQGLLAYVSMASHAYHIHYNTHVSTQRRHEHLPTDHPIRQVVRPTELCSTHVLGNAATKLTQQGGTADLSFPFTFGGDGTGLDKLIEEYEPWDPLDTEDRRTHLVCGGGVGGCAVMRDFKQWWSYIHTHMEQIVRAIYPEDTDLCNDLAIVGWLSEIATSSDLTLRMRLISNISLVFFDLVRHALLSNKCMTHIIQHRYILDPEPVDVTGALHLMLASIATSTEWVPLSTGFAKGCDHRGARRILTRFYNGLANLDIQHPLAKPNIIEVSIAK
jgi:hypothetical protein